MVCVQAVAEGDIDVLRGAVPEGRLNRSHDFAQGQHVAAVFRKSQILGRSIAEDVGRRLRAVASFGVVIPAVAKHDQDIHAAPGRGG